MKKNSILFGFLLVVLIIAIIGSGLIYYYTRDNMTMIVNVFDGESKVEACNISIDNDSKMTNEFGTAKFNVFVREQDSIEVVLNYNDLSQSVFVEIDSLSYSTQYTVIDFDITEKENNVKK
jgi:hypothetical protein